MYKRTSGGTIKKTIRKGRYKRFRTRGRYYRRKRKIVRKNEVKYTSAYSFHIPKNLVSAGTTTLDKAQYMLLPLWPVPGTSDTQRIGDNIILKKFYLRWLYRLPNAVRVVSVRFIIFSFNKILAPGTDNIDNFWQNTPFPINSYLGIVNLEVVRKVYYDKTIVLKNDSGVASNYPTKLFKWNLKRNRIVVFQAGSSVLKNPTDALYMATIVYNQDFTDGDGLGTTLCRCNTYFTD